MLFLTFLQILQMCVLLSAGSELSNPNDLSHFTDVQPSPPKIDMKSSTSLIPLSPHQLLLHLAYRMKTSWVKAKQAVCSGTCDTLCKDLPPRCLWNCSQAPLPQLQPPSCCGALSSCKSVLHGPASQAPEPPVPTFIM